jgi:hypothetical protein
MFDWAYLDGGGAELGRSVRFPDSEAAEEWISTAWRDLAESGVEQVELVDRDRDRTLYRMGLDAD